MMNVATIVSVLPRLLQLRKHEHWNRTQLTAFQNESLSRLRQYTYKHSPFYQRYHRGFTGRPLTELPVLTKSMMMEHFNELLTDRRIRIEDIRRNLNDPDFDKRYLDRYWVTATSGSSGQPGIFLFDRAEWATVVASFARGQEWGGLKIDFRHRRKMAVVSSTSSLHMSARVGLTVKSPWISTLRLAAVEPIAKLTEQLNDFQPDILVAYASMARILAEEHYVGRLRIRPTVVFTSSEVLTEETRRRVEEAWGRILFNEYAATESGGLAAERFDHRGLYLFEDLVVFENVDDQNRPVPAGTYGEKVLLTVLNNRTQPLLRYELHDSVRLASTPADSDVPFSLITDIRGRTEDTLYFPGMQGGEIAIHPSAFHAVMDRVPTNGWQVVQDKDRLTLVLGGLRDVYPDELLIGEIENLLRRQGVLLPVVTVERVPVIPKGAGGKAPLFRSNLAQAVSRKSDSVTA